MMRLSVAAALLAAAACFPLPAAASFDVPRPPATLSPDLTGPWVLQMKPGKRAVLADPAASRAKSVAAARYRLRGIDPAYLPRVVRYNSHQPPGTIVIDTNARYLYLVLGDGMAKRYGVGVGRPGFEWAGERRITAMAKWPAWTPPDEMRQRQPDLPDSMEGGPANPLGARAMYLGGTLYRIHGTSEPWTIGSAVSSGCIRMRNEDVIDLYRQVRIGTRVIVM
ncbi:MAG TPA: L,D-transpeptidase [Bauldia sp.]|nr:L,D-transpeptidase [Bauldia sp.]